MDQNEIVRFLHVIDEELAKDANQGEQIVATELISDGGVLTIREFDENFGLSFEVAQPLFRSCTASRNLGKIRGNHSNSASTKSRGYAGMDLATVLLPSR